MQQQDIHQFIEIPVDPAFTVCFPVCFKPDQFMDQITDRIMFPFRFLRCIQEEDAPSVRRKPQQCPVCDLDDAQDPFCLIAVGFHRIDQDHVALHHI